MAQSHSVELYLGTTRTRLTNWDGYQIVGGDLFKPGSPWTFGLWHSAEQASAWQRLRSEAQLGAPVVVEIDGAPQLNGRIEELSVTDGRDGGVMLTIAGRDLSAPAMDWHADPRAHVTGVTLAAALEALFAPLGIRVVVGVDAGAATEVRTRGRPGGRGVTSSRASRRNRVDRAHPRPGEKVWEVAESIVKRLGYMMWVAPDPDGQLAVVVDVPDYAQAPLWRLEARVRDGRVTPESNLLESEFRASIRDVPTVAYAFGRAARGDTPPARHTAGVANNLFHVATDFLAAGSPLIFANITAATNAALHSPFGAGPEFLNFDSAALPALDQAGGLPGAPAATSAPARGATVTTRRPYANDALARRSLVVSPLPPQPVFLHSARARNPATARQEAARVMAAAMANWRTLTVLVQGHGQTVGGRERLYAVNTMARVVHTLADLDEDMLVQRVEFLGSRREGQRTRLTLGTKGAIALAPETA